MEKGECSSANEMLAYKEIPRKWTGKIKGAVSKINIQKQ